jgi:hypothetical protein
VVRWQLELSTSWRKGGGVVRLKGRSEPPVVVSGLAVHELQMFANHGWHNI